MGQCASRRSSRTTGESWDSGRQSSSEKLGWIAAAREHRSRLYILRRCVVMLLCWHKYGKH
ncbi:hypothetical protein KSP39_PZI008408 [Platanthera zijinensis]|uniref:ROTUNDIFOLIA like 8 n=1 Tax=Platanthera zijinensis TaxID=2320716 RepID=A0AAP0BLK3_9ASPA